MFDAHTAAEFETRDIDATMATMSASPHVTHMPTMTGGHRTAAVRRRALASVSDRVRFSVQSSLDPR
jgi:hypothetical protein